jgi:hypothetical protein
LFFNRRKLTWRIVHTINKISTQKWGASSIRGSDNGNPQPQQRRRPKGIGLFASMNLARLDRSAKGFRVNR